MKTDLARRLESVTRPRYISHPELRAMLRKRKRIEVVAAAALACLFWMTRRRKR